MRFHFIATVFLFPFFQITENTELEFFETSARTGEGVTEVKILFRFSKIFTSYLILYITEDLHLNSTLDVKN